MKKITALVFTIAGYLPLAFSQTLPMVAALCGQQYGCFFVPEGCDPTRTCDKMVTYREIAPDYVEFVLAAKQEANPSSDTYIALGFSRDNLMGDDSVLVCTSKGEVKLTYNRGKANEIVSTPEIDKEMLKIIGQGNANGIFYCQFQRKKVPPLDKRDVLFDLSSDYNLFLVTGSMNKGMLSIHSTDDHSSLFPTKSIEQVGVTRTMNVHLNAGHSDDLDALNPYAPPPPLHGALPSAGSNHGSATGDIAAINGTALPPGQRPANFGGTGAAGGPNGGVGGVAGTGGGIGTGGSSPGLVAGAGSSSGGNIINSGSNNIPNDHNQYNNNQPNGGYNQPRPSDQPLGTATSTNPSNLSSRQDVSGGGAAGGWPPPQQPQRPGLNNSSANTGDQGSWLGHGSEQNNHDHDHGGEVGGNIITDQQRPDDTGKYRKPSGGNGAATMITTFTSYILPLIFASVILRGL